MSQLSNRSSGYLSARDDRGARNGQGRRIGGTAQPRDEKGFISSRDMNPNVSEEGRAP